MAAGPWTLNDRIVPQKIFKRRPANIGLLNHLTIRSFNQNHLLPVFLNFDIDVKRYSQYLERGHILNALKCESVSWHCCLQGKGTIRRLLRILCNVKIGEA